MGAVRVRAALAALAMCGALVLTACRNGDDAAAPEGPPGAAAPSAPGAPSAAGTPAAPAPSKPATTAKPPAPATPTEKKPPAPAPAPACDHKMPISPDTIAVYRYTPEGGSHHLIVRHGEFGCPGPFEPVGEETFYPVSETAKITATAPILPSEAKGKPISTDELASWLTTHPDKGLPFRYHLNAAGVIDTLEEVYVK
ncbi:hypothetical protein EF912_29355 [Streptomyces sp. WAC07061]|uniref:hypothetical protein n=1 Tax=Streptomyces sp. WAC07061 TaxID=2487410 RepID=UPI000F78C9E6|nr:hypothetical protein [Streptomyces sp. WAC07061]RSS44088.1 hypothetical protein EF912_29355 [Streptomyces sp. WAC07061]